MWVIARLGGVLWYIVASLARRPRVGPSQTRWDILDGRFGRERFWFRSAGTDRVGPRYESVPLLLPCETCLVLRYFGLISCRTSRSPSLECRILAASGMPLLSSLLCTHSSVPTTVARVRHCWHFELPCNLRWGHSNWTPTTTGCLSIPSLQPPTTVGRTSPLATQTGWRIAGSLLTSASPLAPKPSNGSKNPNKSSLPLAVLELGTISASYISRWNMASMH